MNRRTASRILLAVAALVLAGLVVLVGCKKKEANEIKIGAILCLTGSGAPYGEDALRGIQLATGEIVSQGGIGGKPLHVVVEDDQTNPAVATSAASKLINQDKVSIIIGAVTSSSMLAAAPIAEKARVVMISPGASNPSITAAGDYIFRNWISDDLEGRAMAQYVVRDEGIRTAAILFINNDYGRGLRDVFKRAFEQLGGRITAIESYNQDDSDFRTQLIKIRETRPDRIYLPGYYREMSLILRQAAELAMTIPFRSVVTFEEPRLLELAGSEAEGVIYSCPYYDSHSTDQRVADFVNGFKRRFGREPGIFAAHAYDATHIIAAVLRACDRCEGDVVKERLYQVKDFPGVTGTTTFDSNGDVIKPVAIKEVNHGKFVFLNRVVP